jgi:uroporphyrinogen decarboxylase
MNSRERILAAINHKQPDKVPVDLSSTGSSGISAIAYDNLVKYLGKEHLPTRIYDLVQQMAQPDDEILDLFGVDVIDIGRTYATENKEWYPITMANGNTGYYPNNFHPREESDGSWTGLAKDGTPIARMPKGGTFFDQTYFPFIDGYPEGMKGLDEGMSKVLWAAFSIPPWSNMDKEGAWEELRARTLKLREQTDKALIVSAGCNLFEWGTFIRRMDNFLMDLYLEPTNVEALLDALMERHLKGLEKICTYLGDIVDMVKFGDDLGTMNGPFMDPEIYRKFFKPRHKQLCDFAKANSSMHTYLHSCGSIYDLMPDLIDAGFEIINPVQTQCRDMEPEKLKREFGKDVTFWGGGIETAGTLNNGTIKEVRAETLNRLEILSKGGGYVFNTVHNILPEVPPENIVAMFDAVKEFNGE